MKQLSNNKCILFFFALFFISGLNAQTSSSYERDWRTDRQKIKIISYNIMDGFSNGSDKDRIARFTAWVKEQSPDVLALNELCGFTEAKLKELAASYGHPYAAIVTVIRSGSLRKRLSRLSTERLTVMATACYIAKF